MKKKVTYEELHKLFHYDPATGLLIRKIPAGNRGKAGTVVGTLENTGYLTVRIKNKNYLVHRIIWFMHHGYFPEHDLDHINRIRHDNRIENLREVSRSCNMKNSNLREDNSSKVKGVCWHKKGKKWKAAIKINNKTIY